MPHWCFDEIPSCKAHFLHLSWERCCQCLMPPQHQPVCRFHRWQRPLPPARHSRWLVWCISSSTKSCRPWNVGWWECVDIWNLSTVRWSVKKSDWTFQKFGQLAAESSTFVEHGNLCQWRNTGLFRIYGGLLSHVGIMINHRKDPLLNNQDLMESIAPGTCCWACSWGCRCCTSHSSRWGGYIYREP